MEETQMLQMHSLLDKHFYFVSVSLDISFQIINNYMTSPPHGDISVPQSNHESKGNAPDVKYVSCRV